MSGALELLPPEVQVKFVNMYGAVKAEQLARELTREIGAVAASDPDAQLRLGDALIRRGGVLAAIGRSVRIQAYLKGAGQPGA